MNSGVYTNFTRNVVAPGTGKYESTLRPNDGAHIGRRGVVFCHGFGGSAQTGLNWATNPGVPRLLRALVRQGVAVVAADVGGDAFGNDLAMTRIDQARTYLATLGCATDKVLLVGDSMGNYATCRYAADNPTKVAAVLGVEPGVDLESVRTNNTLSARDSVNTAWGLAAGSTSTTAPVPARGNLMARAAKGDLKGLRYLAYYSTADVVVPPQSVATLVSGIGPTAERRAVPGNPPHGAALTSAVPHAEAAAWLVQSA